MEFRTAVQIDKQSGFINHHQQLLGIGSCFVQQMGAALIDRKFDYCENPFGISFNPYSIAKNIRAALSEEINEDLIVERENNFFHYDYHSSSKGKTKNELINRIKGTHQLVKNKLLTADRLFITVGTAWVFKYLATGDIVGNCHKIPQKNFEKVLLDLADIVELYISLIKELKELNPQIEIVLTVSPVRHQKNGLVDNNRSKSVLLLFVHELCDYFNFVHYFPSYELVMDDLRDYRYFEKDMVHPNEQAVEYVYERLAETYFDEKTKELAQLGFKINRAEQHRVLHAEKKELSPKVQSWIADFDRLKREF